MKIIKIEINNYKSIKEPVEIHFTDSLPTVLIGKNGSGKTNILEALSIIAEANENYWGMSTKQALDYKLHIKLCKEDVDMLFPGEKIDEEKCQFIAYSGKNCKIDRIESEYLVPFLNSEVIKIRRIAEELKKALDTYKKQLDKIAYNERNELTLRGFEITDFKNSTTNYYNIEFRVKFLIEQTENLVDSLLTNFEHKENILQFKPIYDYYRLDDTDKLAFRLKYVKPDLAPFETKFINVNETAIKREITKINKATKDSCEKISALLKKLDKYTTRLKGALTGEQLGQYGDDTFFQFIREVQKCVGRKCLFLRNESSDIIFRSEERGHEYYRTDKSFVILQSYLNKVYNGVDKKELLGQIQGDKDFALPNTALKAFEKYLNSSMPEFESGMYNRISIDRSKEKILEILLHEKSGDIVPLSLTSAGRRWYFTYYFMKNTLEPGDLFIIDEPAAMLHPCAQKEVQNELLELEKQGIKVVFSTHSPYLIPNNWKSVHFVSMGHCGTTITKEKYFEAMKQIAGGDVFNLQELIDKYKKCGAVTAANNCYNALVKKYGTIRDIPTNSNNVPFGYDAIESWKKKRRGTSFENVILIATKNDISLEELL